MVGESTVASQGTASSSPRAGAARARWARRVAATLCHAPVALTRARSFPVSYLGGEHLSQMRGVRHGLVILTASQIMVSVVQPNLTSEQPPRYGRMEPTMRAWRPVFALAALSVVLGGCGSEASTADTAADSGPWSFTDGSGEVVKADKTPTRIIAHAGEAAALISFGIKPVGIYADESVKTDPNLKDLDLSGIEIIGEEWGKIDVEKAAALRPDLIVGDWWPAEKAHSGLEEGVEDKSKKLAELAPVVGVSQGKSIVDLANGYEDLAESLGADVDDPKIAENKKRFQVAVTAFKDAAAAKPGLTVAAMSPADDKVYVANPEYAPELLDFQSWGLKVINPKSPDPSFPYWENLSWENADKYQPDLILWDGRSYTPTANADWGKKQPTWFKIKAAKAGATVSWPAYWLHTYGHFATELDKLTVAIKAADENIGA